MISLQRRRSAPLAIEKVDGDDAVFELELLIAAMTKRLRIQFVNVVTRVRDTATINTIERLLLEGRMQEAMEIGKAHYTAFADDWLQVYIRAAKDTASFLGREIAVIAVFDQMNSRAVSAMRDNTLRLVRELTRGQAEAAQEAIIEGVVEGWNPRQTARAVRETIGLTAKQQRAVANFRKMLEDNNPASLTRKLRDRRFDATIRRALAGGEVLDQATIKKMVDRYRERFLKYRAEVVSRTEALRAVHQGNQEMYRQAFDLGELAPDDLVQVWNTALDARVRDTHKTMHRQRRPIGQPFVAGSGALLMYPTDPAAPASETVQCRCALATRFRRRGERRSSGGG